MTITELKEESSCSRTVALNLPAGTYVGITSAFTGSKPYLGIRTVGKTPAEAAKLMAEARKALVAAIEEEL